jgi:hypothetical protein
VRKKDRTGLWLDQDHGELRKLPMVGLAAVRGWVAWTFAAYNLIQFGGIGEWWEPSPT